jgi:hypothetical protein
MKNFGDNIQTIGKRLINEAVSLGWNTSRYILMLFRNFHPSARRTLFFQKKIKQFNVEFMETIVIDQYLTKTLFSPWVILVCHADFFALLKVVHS